MVTSTQLKQFFKRQFDIPVLVATSTSRRPNKWVTVRIKPNPGSYREPLTYPHRFPPELGNRCLRIVYKNSPHMLEQSYGGNIEGYSLSMYQSEWVELLEQYAAELASQIERVVNAE